MAIKTDIFKYFLMFPTHLAFYSFMTYFVKILKFMSCSFFMREHSFFFLKCCGTSSTPALLVFVLDPAVCVCVFMGFSLLIMDWAGFVPKCFWGPAQGLGQLWTLILSLPSRRGWLRCYLDWQKVLSQGFNEVTALRLWAFFLLQA